MIWQGYLVRLVTWEAGWQSLACSLCVRAACRDTGTLFDGFVILFNFIQLAGLAKSWLLVLKL